MHGRVPKHSGGLSEGVVTICFQGQVQKQMLFLREKAPPKVKQRGCDERRDKLMPFLLFSPILNCDLVIKDPR